MTHKENSPYATTTDWFLTDKLSVLQPKYGFRAGTDSLLVAAAVPAQSGDSVLELGCGVGVASMALAVRVPGLALSLVEQQDDMAHLARRNLAHSGNAAATRLASWDVRVGDALAKPLFVQDTRFAHSFCNPPFFDAAGSRASPNVHKAAARQLAGGADGIGDCIGDWAKAMLRWTASKGSMTMICRAQSLAQVLASFGKGAGDIQVIPIYPRADAPAINVIIRARKDRRGVLKIHPGVVIRDTAGEISPLVRQVQRYGQTPL